MHHCISADPHDRIINPVVRYFGCVPFAERKDCLNSLDPAQQDRIKDEEHRVERLRQFVKLSAIPKCSSPSRDATPPGGWNGEALVTNVEKCREKWREDLKKRQDALNHSHGESTSGNSLQSRSGSISGIPSAELAGSSRARKPGTVKTVYDPDKDIKAYLAQFTKVDGEDQRVVYRGAELANQDDPQGNIRDSQASQNFERWKRAVWKGQFPAQKAMTYDLLFYVCFPLAYFY